MKGSPAEKNPLKQYFYEREDAIRQSMIHNSKTRHARTRQQNSFASIQTKFSTNHLIKLNKGKKFLLQQERNTQIERSNRILHEKLTRYANKSNPNVVKTTSLKPLDGIQHSVSHLKSRDNKHKFKTSPSVLPTIKNESREKSIKISKSRSKNGLTLFMGHSKIDGVDFKIKLIIADGIYYLMAENEHTKIILEMPEQDYWGLHYNELEENPCNIFQYLQIQKGKVFFRVKKEKKDEEFKKQKNKIGQKKRNRQIISNQANYISQVKEF